MVCAQKNNIFNRALVAPLNVIPVKPKAMWRIHVDLMGPFPETERGNKYVAIAICAFLKYVEGMRNFFIIQISWHIVPVLNNRPWDF